MIGFLRRLAAEPSLVFWYLYTQFVCRPKLGSLGRRSLFLGRVQLIGGRSIFVGEGVRIRGGARIECARRPTGDRGTVVIGDGVSAEQDLHIVAVDRVEVGADVCLSLRCTIVDSAHPIGLGFVGNRVRYLEADCRPVRIAERVFIGAGAVVLRGVVIGANSVVGANAVVSRDVAPNVVVGGVPAIVIKSVT